MRSTASGGMFGFCRIAIAILPIELGVEHRLQRAAVQIEEHAARDRDDRERDEDVAVLPAAEDRARRVKDVNEVFPDSDARSVGRRLRP